MTLNATKLRANLYRVLEQVIDTGVPVDVELHGKHVEIRAKLEPGGKLARLVRRPNVMVGDPTRPTFDEKAWLKKWNARLGPRR